ncbi:PREDICTED: TLR4 interactor with leucine rich repeats, partial [Tinamus guttatus]|uniref:TLR4 interactor with leucine rich repeats n=1 Tax=Tinamus guttatus TaxID=94827 RepID=UPI00052F3D62
RSLPPRAFERLGRLEELYLGNNLLPALAPGTLSALAKLRVLYVNDNEIGRLSAASFSGLGSLVKLRLDGNELGSLGDSTFSGLLKLLYLHLESNRIRWLSRGAFTGLAKLRFLDLSGNQQSSLRHPDIFGPLRSLHTLLLASNSLQQLAGGLFQHLPGLAKLSLSGNRLSHLAPDAFVGLGLLKELRLEGNMLSHLPTALLEPLSSLEALDLSRNALTTLHPAAFGHLTRLRELSLRDNALATLPGELFASSPALYRLELEGNAWSCDCRLRGLKRWLGAWHSQGRLLTVFVQCHLPPALTGKYLDYLQDAQLLPPPDGSACHDGASLSSASPLPLAQEQLWLLPAAEGIGGNSSGSHGLLRGPPRVPPSASTARLLGAPEGAAVPAGSSPTPPMLASLGGSQAVPPSAAWPRRAGKARAAGGPPLVSDPCDFNKRFLCNLSVEAVSSSSVTVRWAVRPHRSPRLLGPVRFRLLFDRFGAAVKFQLFVYLPERSEPATTLQRWEHGLAKEAGEERSASPRRFFAIQVSQLSVAETSRCAFDVARRAALCTEAPGAPPWRCGRWSREAPTECPPAWRRVQRHDRPSLKGRRRVYQSPGAAVEKRDFSWKARAWQVHLPRRARTGALPAMPWRSGPGAGLFPWPSLRCPPGHASSGNVSKGRKASPPKPERTSAWKGI